MKNILIVVAALVAFLNISANAQQGPAPSLPIA